MEIPGTSALCYFVGAISGLTAGTVLALGELSGVQRRKLEAQLRRSLAEGLADAEAATRRLATAGYVAAGAAAGLYAGAKYGAASLCLYWVEDEVKIRILAGSPIKYSFQDLDHLSRTWPTWGSSPDSTPRQPATPTWPATPGAETPPCQP